MHSDDTNTNENGLKIFGKGCLECCDVCVMLLELVLEPTYRMYMVLVKIGVLFGQA